MRVREGVRKGVIFCDEQIPYEIDAVEGLLPGFLADFKPDIAVRLGDMLDMEALQGWNSRSPQSVDWEEIRVEIKRANFLMDLQDKHLPAGCDKHFWMGNHEERLMHFRNLHQDWWRKNVSALPYLASDLKLKQRGYSMHGQNQLRAFGKLHMFHGNEYGDFFTKKILLNCGVNVACGHVHTAQRYTMNSRVDSAPRSAWGIGCLCSRNPRWKNGATNAWTNGFAVFFVQPDGLFNLYPIDIVRGSFVAPSGKLYK